MTMTHVDLVMIPLFKKRKVSLNATNVGKFLTRNTFLLDMKRFTLA